MMALRPCQPISPVGAGVLVDATEFGVVRTQAVMALRACQPISPVGTGIRVDAAEFRVP